MKQNRLERLPFGATIPQKNIAKEQFLSPITLPKRSFGPSRFLKIRQGAAPLAIFPKERSTTYVKRNPEDPVA